MSIVAQVSKESDTVTIHISGRFDFNLHREFRKAAEQGKGPDTCFVIDLGGTEYVDSSALGMLLLLRERAGGENGRISIINSSPSVKKILDTANFQKLFKIA